MKNKNIIYKNKKNLFRLFFFITIFGLGLFSCKPDKQDDPATPANPKSRFIGTWKCDEVSLRDGAGQPFNVHISDSVNDYVLLANFYGVGYNKKAKAIINGDIITIVAGQNISGKIILKGSGTMNNSSNIKLNYIIDDGNPHTDTCSASLSK